MYCIINIEWCVYMKRRSAIVIAILIMTIGFAAISTTLIINGNATVSENTDDFSVIFTAAALDGIDVYANVIDDTKKIITFETSELKALNQTSVLTYEVTNNSANYDAEVSVNCKVKDNTTSKYTSIKNELENNATIVKAKETLNGMLTVTLNKTATEEVKEEYVCTLEFNAVERNELAVSSINLYNFIKDSADTTTVIDYSARSGAEGKETNGIYTTTATESNIPVYYYRGKVDNNIIFGNFCWKIIRTTETGGIKIIYNGVPSNGSCDNNGEDTIIGTSAWNTKYDDAAYVGYMFGINNTGSTTSKTQAQANTYQSTIKTYIDNWFKTNFSENNTLNEIEDTVFCNDRSIVGTTNNNLGTEYGTLGYGKNWTRYGAVSRATYNTNIPKPSLVCSQANDKFTVDSKNGNGKLTYPVGLITLDEAVLAGFNTYASNNSDYKDSTNYLNNGVKSWTFSPISRNKYGYSVGGCIFEDSYIHEGNVNYSFGVRPVVSLASGTFVTGEGTTTNPYVAK